MKPYPLAILLVLCLSTLISCKNDDPHYFNETPPGVTPKVFAHGIVSTDDQFEFGSVYSKNRSEFYYGVVINGKAETRVMKFENGTWTKPEQFLVHDTYSYNDPFLSPDENRIYVISDMPLTGEGPAKDYDIWYRERQGAGWSKLINAGPNINSEKNEYYISFTNSGTMYFSSNRNEGSVKDNYDIYSSEFRDGEFQPANVLGSAINTDAYEADVFVAPDESYVVFSAKRPGGLGSGDLFVSFRNADGTWTESVSLGNTINTDTDDFCPFVTPDGKYLFYASRDDIYWVSSEVIHKLR